MIRELSLQHIHTVIKMKNKNISIVLAILFSSFTWLYTYDKDAGKFWLGLFVNTFGIIFLFLPNIIIWIWAIIDTVSKEKEFYDKY